METGAPPSTEAQDEGPKLSRGQIGFGIFSLALANFMAVLDMSIANVAVPHISGALAVAPSEGTWVITSYIVAEAIIVPLSGWLSQRFGMVRVFLTSITLFTIASAMCGLANSLPFLLAFRIIQGLAAGPMMPMSQALLQRIVPRERMAGAMSIWIMTTTVAPILGPVAGGAIVDAMGWEWVFFLNVPIGLSMVFMGLQLLPRFENKLRKTEFDTLGLILLVVWVGSLELMLDLGREHDWFSSSFIMTLTCAGIIAFLAFLIWEGTAKDPIVDIRIFRSRGFAMSCIGMGLVYALMFTSSILVPLWLQTDLGYTAQWAGFAIAGLGVGAVISGALAGKLLPRYDPRLLLSIGIGIYAISFAMRSQFTSQSDFLQISIPSFVQGLGAALFFTPINAMAMGAVRPDQVPAAAGILGFLRSAAAATAAALVTTNWQNEIEVQRGSLVGAIQDQDQIIQRFEGLGLTHAQAIGRLEDLAQHQAVMLATNSIFVWLTLLTTICIAYAWMIPLPKRAIYGRSEH